MRTLVADEVALSVRPKISPVKVPDTVPIVFVTEKLKSSEPAARGARAKKQSQDWKRCLDHACEPRLGHEFDHKRDPPKVHHVEIRRGREYRQTGVSAGKLVDASIINRFTA